MNVLVVGASGATGRLLVKELLTQGARVKIVVRSVKNLPAELTNHPKLQVTHASLLELSDAEMRDLVRGCDAIASCLGHNLTFRGLFLPPRRLVRDAARRLCKAVRATAPENTVKYVLMNTSGNRNGDLSEPISVAQHIVIGLLRLLLPPHIDNEQAADFLRKTIGQRDPVVEWVAVRPDGLVDHPSVTGYELFPSPTRSAIFDPGKTSRINVAHFMANLITDQKTWRDWKGQMPVIYNANE